MKTAIEILKQKSEAAAGCSVEYNITQVAITDSMNEHARNALDELVARVFANPISLADLKMHVQILKEELK